MKQRNRWCTPLVFTILVNHAGAQQWKAEAPIAGKPGVHAIVLSPGLVGLSGRDLSDVRLLDSAGVEVPYVLNIEQREAVTNEFHDFRILRNERVDKQTVVELEGPDRGFVLEAIHLIIRNAEVRKEVALTGSDDGWNWFLIKNDMLLLGGNAAGTNVLRMIDLPPSDYQRYRLVINDSVTAPVQIIGAQWCSQGRDGGAFEMDSAVRWSIKEEPRATRISVACPRMIVLDRLVVDMGDSVKYHRPIRIERNVSVTTGRGRKRRTVQRAEVAASSHISGRDLAAWDHSSLRLDTFDIIIDNGDDRPLPITDIQFLQLRRSILAGLQPGQRYTVTTGEPKKRAPQYDLAHLKSQLPGIVATLRHGPLIAVPSAVEEGPTIDPSQWWIWAGLVAVLGLVGFMAVRMLREPPSTT